MTNKDYILTIDELPMQIHRVLKDINPSFEISGKDIRKFLISDNLGIHFPVNDFAKEFNLDSEWLIEKIYLELMVEYEKNWHDRVFFRILKDKNKILFEWIKQENK